MFTIFSNPAFANWDSLGICTNGGTQPNWEWLLYQKGTGKRSGSFRIRRLNKQGGPSSDAGKWVKKYIKHNYDSPKSWSSVIKTGKRNGVSKYQYGQVRAYLSGGKLRLADNCVLIKN